MRRRACIAVGVAAIGLTAACSSDQSTGTNSPILTAAQLALHFDTLAGALQASSPGDVRLTWYQDIASIVARGVSPSNIMADLEGGRAILLAASEIDAFADTVNGVVADSTYRLAAWFPATQPTEFIDLRLRFLPGGTGKADTASITVKFYPDASGNVVSDNSAVIGIEALGGRGTCVLTPLQHLTVPQNPCSQVAVLWAAAGGTGLLVINPAVQVSGTYLTH